MYAVDLRCPGHLQTAYTSVSKANIASSEQDTHLLLLNDRCSCLMLQDLPWCQHLLTTTQTLVADETGS